MTDGDDLTISSLTKLDREFAPETQVIDGGRNAAASLDNSYERFTEIAGTPIRDGYHFGSTVTNDYGRTLWQGSELHYRSHCLRPRQVRLRHTPMGSTNMRLRCLHTTRWRSRRLQQADQLPFGWNLRFGTTSRPRPVEAYVSAKRANWQLNFGYQALWWGPNRSTSLYALK